MNGPAHQLVAIVYPDEYKAAEVEAALFRLQKEYLLTVDDACYVTKDAEGKLHLHQSHSLTGLGAVGGGFWGLLIGFLFFVPLVGLAIGAGAGALAAHFSDYGIDDDFMKSLSAGLGPSTSALFVLVRDVNQERVIPEISKYGGTVLRTSLTADAEQKLQAALNAGSASSAAIDTPPAGDPAPGEAPNA
jgi:uncharacterized membrane protein